MTGHRRIRRIKASNNRIEPESVVSLKIGYMRRRLKMRERGEDGIPSSLFVS